MAQTRKTQEDQSTIRALKRGLAALRVVNEEGPLAPTDLALRLDLPRSTAHRLLASLAELGYVVRDFDGRYRIGDAARALGDRAGALDPLVEAAMPVMRAVTSHLVWPVSLAVRDGLGMAVRATTHDASPLTFGAHLQLASGFLGFGTSTAGKLYLASLPAAGRSALLDVGTCPQRATLERELPRIAAEGWAQTLNPRADGCGGQTASIGVPIVVEGTFRAALVIYYFHRALADQAAQLRCLPVLREAAAKIAARLQTPSHTMDALPPMLPVALFAARS